ncbi:hypothetical protein [Sphingomonas sp. 35-24ZXX]|uniref:hypothetical protein n=1 Tax=Sphingomonas sp. 35-24ZXX TaxID=1545915 RepID=UPI000A89944C|nr:hypothetical protein [Sphingomonas sp. 35-24ZXX]
MTDIEDHKPADNDDAANEPVDCTEETAQRAGAKQTSLKQDDEPSTEPDMDKDDVSEADLDEAIEESMDASDPPSFTQP